MIAVCGQYLRLGHMAAECWRAATCQSCGGVGHKGANCHAKQGLLHRKGSNHPKADDKPPSHPSTPMKKQKQHPPTYPAMEPQQAENQENSLEEEHHYISLSINNDVLASMENMKRFTIGKVTTVREGMVLVRDVAKMLKTVMEESCEWQLLYCCVRSFGAQWEGTRSGVWIQCIDYNRDHLQLLLEIQATIPSTPENPSKKPMWKGVVVAYIIVPLCYFSVTWIGYRAFGNSVNDNILISLEKPVWLIAAANMTVVIHVIGSYLIYAMAVFDMMETVLVKKFRFPPGIMLRLIARSLFVGTDRNKAHNILDFTELPCIIWLAVYKPKRFSLSWLINWVLIVLGVILMILAAIGGLRNIILSAKSYKFFS
ncbi:hypothetical protein J5N97_021051 [Dioscorea zingiberensis]|uniref:Amino acid transporter transmembrane domain-containing protein n=1 Tax=Dioscorea zingiberensis TaxID=325984 RepID=A0A9D5CIA5_9LILI|nr:hypothetical protein J5N97_021051 [Dioscorea zingiberensis]